MATDPISLRIAALRLRVDIAKAKGAGGGNQPRHPAGSSLGGQFAPKGGGFGGGGREGIKSFFASLFGGSSLSGGSGAGVKTLPDPNYGKHYAPVPPAHTVGRPNSVKHHAKDDQGRDVYIHRPKQPTAADAKAWTDPEGVVTVTPGAKVPASLGGVPLRAWNPGKDFDWTKAPGQNPALEEGLPDLAGHKFKHAAAGVIIQEDDGRVWLTSPTNGYGGYRNTFPKGTQEHGLNLQQTAIKEAWEETGLKIEITGVLGDFERTTSVSRFFLARRVGGSPARQGWESQAMRLVPRSATKSFLNMPVDRDIMGAFWEESDIGKGRRPFADITYLTARLDQVLNKAKGAAAGGKDKAGGHWEKQPRWPGGTPLGGQWKTYDGDGLIMPPGLGSSKAAAAWSAKQEAAYGFAKAGDWAKVQTIHDQLVPAAQAKGWKAAGGNEGAKFKAAQYVQGLMAEKDGLKLAVAKTEKLAGPADLGSYKKIEGKPGGSNPGGVYLKGGTKWLVKGANHPSDDRAKNEVLAAKLMQAAGIGAPNMHLVNLGGQYGGGLGVASEMIGLKGWSKNNPADLAAAQSEFAVHAWLANYDAVGQPVGDNLAKSVDGKIFNFDPGGALLYRAQGLPKTLTGGMLPHQAGEWVGMRTAAVNPYAAAVYGGMSNSQLVESAKKLQAVSDATIKQLVAAYGPGDAAKKEALTAALIARRDDILVKTGLKTTSMKMGASVSKPVSAPQATAGANTPAATGGGLKGTPIAVPGALAGAGALLLHNTEPGHSKFWSIKVTASSNGGYVVTKQWGKIGTLGQAKHVGEHPSLVSALIAANTEAAAKLAKGYTVKLNTAPGGTTSGAVPTGTFMSDTGQIKVTNPTTTGPLGGASAADIGAFLQAKHGYHSNSLIAASVAPAVAAMLNGDKGHLDTTLKALAAVAAPDYVNADSKTMVAGAVADIEKLAQETGIVSLDGYTAPGNTVSTTGGAADYLAVNAKAQALADAINDQPLATKAAYGLVVDAIKGTMTTSVKANAIRALENIGAAATAVQLNEAKDGIEAFSGHLYDSLLTYADAVMSAKGFNETGAAPDDGGDPILAAISTNPFKEGSMQAQVWHHALAEFKSHGANLDAAKDGFEDTVNWYQSQGHIGDASSIIAFFQSKVTGAQAAVEGQAPAAVPSSLATLQGNANNAIAKVVGPTAGSKLAAQVAVVDHGLKHAAQNAVQSVLDELEKSFGDVPTGTSIGDAVAAVNAYASGALRHLQGHSPKAAPEPAAAPAGMQKLSPTQVGTPPKISFMGVPAGTTVATKVQTHMFNAKSALVNADMAVLQHAYDQLNALKGTFKLGSKARMKIASAQAWVVNNAKAAGLKIEGGKFAVLGTTAVDPAKAEQAAKNLLGQVTGFNNVNLTSPLGKLTLTAVTALQAGDDKALATAMGNIAMSGSVSAPDLVDKLTDLAAVKGNMPMSTGQAATITSEPAANTYQSNYTAPLPSFDATASANVAQPGTATPAGQAPAATAGLQLPPAPKAPTFMGMGASAYTAAAAKMIAAYNAGDTKALDEAITKPGGGYVFPVYSAGAKAGTAKTMGGQQLQALHAKLLGDLQAAQKAQTAAAIDVQPGVIPAPGTSVGNNPAMPTFDDKKMPATNTNAAPHNKKVDQIAALAAKGDVKGILALNYGTNTYGKKQAKLANDVLAALGSGFQVDLGQKANSHPALSTSGTFDPTGGKSAALAAKDLPPKLDFINWKGPGQGLSSKAAFNEQNQQLFDKMTALALAGDFKGLQNLTYQPINEAGAPVGAPKPVSQHQSQHITGHHDYLTQSMHEKLNPPKPLEIFEAKQAAATVAKVAAAFPPKPLGASSKKVPSAQAIGHYIALGQVKGHEKLIPAKQSNFSSTQVAQASADRKLWQNDVEAEKFRSAVQGHGGHEYHKGWDKPSDVAYGAGHHNPITGAQLMVRAKAAHKWARKQPPGTKIYKWENLSPDAKKKIESAQPGLIIMNPAPACASRSETNTKGFGPSHRWNIVFAEGAKGLNSFSSGSHSHEQEVTLLPNHRFMIIEHKKAAQTGKGYAETTVLLLPPDPDLDSDGYTTGYGYGPGWKNS